MLSVGRPRDGDLDALASAQRGRPFSYPEVGASRGSLPHGYHHVRRVVPLGHGERAFIDAAAGLRRWQAHRLADVAVHPRDAPVEEGSVVVLTVPFGPLHVSVACGVVYVVDEPHRFGFAYGTLPHHMLEGEEAFVVEHGARGDVQFEITAFFRPRGPVMRALGPAVHAADTRLVQRYQRALQRHVGEKE